MMARGLTVRLDVERRLLDEVDAEIRALEDEIQRRLREVTA